MAYNNQREYITAISIDKGIITLIQPDGTIGYYRQRGIQLIQPKLRDGMILFGYIDENWNTYSELPKNWSISYEDTEIMGRAYAGFQVEKTTKMLQADIAKLKQMKSENK